MSENNLGMDDRLRRNGRPPRTHVVATRFTAAEVETIKTAASSRGLTAREWAREAMLHAAKTVPTDFPVLTEVVALRMLLNTILRPVALGQSMTPEAYAQALAEVRTEKHEAAQDMLAQYQTNNGGN